MNDSSARILSLAATLVVAGALSAHGGRYRGAPAMSTPPPASPSPPGAPVGPPRQAPPPVVPPRPLVPGGAIAAPTTPRGVPLGEDVTRWHIWWDMNKDRYLGLRSKVRAGGPVTGGDEFFLGASRREMVERAMAPLDADVVDKVLPALHRALLDTSQRDLVTACLIAMAKVGRDHQSFALVPVLAKYVRDRDQEVRETAALALGVSRMPASLRLLEGLVLDSGEGRKLSDRRNVDQRVRAFAAYALGILGANGSADIKTKTYAILAEALMRTDRSDRDLQVAIVNAVGALRLAPERSSKEKRVLWRALPTLLDFYGEDTGRGATTVRAHVPIALGRLLGRGASTDHTRLMETLGEELRTSDRRPNEIRQSAAIALGQVAPEAHAEVSDKLYAYFRNGRDQQARSFCLIAMGQIGGQQNRIRLLRALSLGKKAITRPWAALGLGVLAYRERERGHVDTTIGDALRQQLRTVKNKDSLGAFAIGLGLCGHVDAASDMRDLLEHNRNHPLAGYLCVGMALMQDKESVGAIRQILYRSVRRPDILRRSAIALGVLSDKQAVDFLLDVLREEDASTAKLAAVSGALQFIGDRRTVDTLLKLLLDRDATKLSRAFAAAALGGIVDPQPLPFAVPYAENSNYRAAVFTLTNGATGILDIL